MSKHFGGDVDGDAGLTVEVMENILVTLPLESPGEEGVSRRQFLKVPLSYNRWKQVLLFMAISLLPYSLKISCLVAAGNFLFALLFLVHLKVQRKK